MISKILVPLDGSPVAEEALVVAGTVAEGLDSRLLIVRVVTPPVAGPAYRPGLLQDLQAAQLREAEDYLRGIASKLRADRLRVDTRVLSGDDGTARSLIDFAAREGCQLIAMGSHGMGGAGWEVFGSVAQKVLHAAPCPVLVVRPATSRVLEHEEEIEEERADEMLLRDVSAVEHEKSRSS